MRDRLVELLKEAHESWLRYVDECAFNQTALSFSFEQMFADHLLAEGVIVPPCKVGDTVYWAFYDKGEEIAEVFEGFIRGLSIGHNGTAWFSVVYNNGLTYEHPFKYYWNNTVFLTRSEAEQALAERRDDGT